MSKNYMRDWENFEDEMMDEMAINAQRAKIAAKNKQPKVRPHAEKKESYISMNKKGAASAAKRAASAAKRSQAPQGRYEEDSMTELRDELGCGKGRGKGGKRNYRR